MHVSTIPSCNKMTLLSFYGAIAKYQISNHFGCAKLFCRSWDAAAGTNLDTPGASNFVVEISNWCRKYKRLTSEKVCFSWSREDFSEPAIHLGEWNLHDVELKWNFHRPHTTSTSIRTMCKKPFLKGSHACKKLFSVVSVPGSSCCCFMLFPERDPGPNCTVLPLHRWRRICNSGGLRPICELDGAGTIVGCQRFFFKHMCGQWIMLWFTWNRYQTVELL